MIYLDHNASSPLRPSAKRAMLEALEACGNASSVHAAGRRARARIETAREEVATLVDAPSSAVVFTSGATEANALALRGAVAGAAAHGAPIARLIVSAVEHESVLATAKALAETNPRIAVEIVPVDAEGRVDPETLASAIANGEGRPLVSVMAANNETGVVQDIAAMSRVVRACEGALFHIDAVQAAARIPVSFRAWGADYLTLSAHKIGGPQGAGALIVAEDAPLESQMLGGGQEMRRRAGTENVAAIAGFGAVAVEAMRNEAGRGRVGAMRDAFETRLREIAPAVVIFGANARRLPNTTNFAIPDLSAETALIALDLDGIAVSSGSACSSGKVTPSHVLAGMAVVKTLARCAVRVSFGWSNADDDYEPAIRSLERLIARRKAA